MALKLMYPDPIQRPKAEKAKTKYAGYKKGSKGPSYLSGNGKPRTLLP